MGQLTAGSGPTPSGSQQLSATQILHRLTSYAVLSDWDAQSDDPRMVRFDPNDLERLPLWHKRYSDDLVRIALPHALPPTTTPAAAVLSGSAPNAAGPPAVLDLAQLARVLFLSAGITRTTTRPGGRIIPFRAAGSAGGRFPLEVYVSVPVGHQTLVPPGVHWYDPERHELVTVASPPKDGLPALVVTAVPWRTGWRYRERGFRHVYWDAGTMLAQTLAVADSAGIPAELYLDFPDAQVGRLVGADGTHEFPVAVVALGPDTAGPSVPALEPTGPAVAGEVDTDPVEFPLVTAAQHAGDIEVLGVPVPRGAEVPLAGGAGDAPIEEIVLRRGSQRRMDPGGSLPRAMVEASMAAALRGIDVPHWLVAHAVDGLAPGVLRWPELDRPVRAGDLRDELYRVALDQNLASEAAFVVVGAADLAALDDRGYRRAQLLAGVVEGRLHLMAYALGAGASGMTFLDDEIPGLLGAPVAGLLFTCVGVPEYRSRPGGGPRHPVAVRTVVPRMGD